VLHDHAPDLPGVVTVVGGKLTTYRQLAEDAVDDVFKRLGRKAPKCVTAHLPLPGAVGDLAAVRAALLAAGLGERTADRLVALYGGRAAAVAELAGEDPALREVLAPGTGTLVAELVFAVRHELAVTLTDVLARRVLLAFEPGHGLDVVERAAEVLGAELRWDADERKAQVAEYEQWLSHLAVPGRTTGRATSGQPS
jgi:glycerol-3-phosphate dehydrogenase